jgi:hypothetical protein
VVDAIAREEFSFTDEFGSTDEVFLWLNGSEDPMPLHVAGKRVRPYAESTLPSAPSDAPRLRLTFLREQADSMEVDAYCGPMGSDKHRRLMVQKSNGQWHVSAVLEKGSSDGLGVRGDSR